MTLLEKKKIDPEIVVKEVLKDRKLISVLIRNFRSDRARLKFTSAKMLVAISAEHPNIVQPYFNFFKEQLRNPNSILKWNSMNIIAHLTKVDMRKKFEALFNEYFGMLAEGDLVTASTVVKNSSVIVKNKPHLERKITPAILKVDVVPLPTAECRNILKGHAIMAFDRYFPLVKNKRTVIEFVKRELKNRRAATRKKARCFLKKWQ